ncbi:MAG TPA: hypothetical protein VNJ70_08205 [Thermoanaerobaculia bacterium]|nr:hypothetical protein [Thermoanaerobaculia bacterium]
MEEPPQLEDMTDKELMKRRAEVWNTPIHREAVDAEIQRRQLVRAASSAAASKRASYAALVTSAVALFTLAAKTCGYLP